MKFLIEEETLKLFKWHLLPGYVLFHFFNIKKTKNFLNREFADNNTCTLYTIRLVTLSLESSELRLSFRNSHPSVFPC